jgi:hypothetical protein
MSPGYSQKENTLRFEQCLDGRAALHAREVIEATPPETELVLDFSRVRDLEYMALATVIVAIARRRDRPVALRGLCDQHLRVLRYLGIDIDWLARRVGAAPAIPGTVSADGEAERPPDSATARHSPVRLVSAAAQ